MPSLVTLIEKADTKVLIDLLRALVETRQPPGWMELLRRLDRRERELASRN